MNRCSLARYTPPRIIAATGDDAGVPGHDNYDEHSSCERRAWQQRD